jgi:hydroxyacylglutathione hydrolase
MNTVNWRDDMELVALPALSDNYIWLWQQGHQAVVVDPGDEQIVLAALQEHQLELAAILVTHHHADHTGGVQKLYELTQCEIFASVAEPLDVPHHSVSHASELYLLGQHVQVIDIPGHTAGHVAYVLTDLKAPVLFCGDTLFSGGCGRIFEGTPAQMLHSLTLLNQLPGNTKVCCAHEYTLSNLKFAAAVEPDNLATQQHIAHCEQLRAQSLFTLPSTLTLERQINPFLRTRVDSVIQSVSQHASLNASAQHDEVAVFAALRQWKNEFR